MQIERYYILALTIFFLILTITTSNLSAFECRSSMYNDISFIESINAFSPYEKIFLKLVCNKFPSGKKAFFVNWTKNNLGVIRTDKQEIVINSPNEFMVYFWIKLHKNGVLSRGLTNKDFDDKYYGDWTAEAFVNNELITVTSFSVREGTE